MSAANKTIRLGLIQHACPPQMTPAQHFTRAQAMIRDAAAQGAQLIVTQELFTSHYFPQTEDDRQFDLAEPIPGPTSTKLCELAESLNVSIAGSLFERRTAGVYHNTCIVIDSQGRIISRYRKMHIPDDPGFYEKFYFTPGDTGFQTITTRYGKIGVLICWDQWFPEAARLTALSGAQILFYPTAIGYQAFDESVADKQVQAWQTIQKAHSIANGVFTVVVNRVGQEDQLNFWGKSFVSDPFGEVLAEASAKDPEVLVIDCDLSLIEETRQGWPFLRDRRVDAYQNLTRLFIDQNDN
jgi:N-carbamoylputrescine amidase